MDTATIAKEEIKEGSYSRTPSHIRWEIFTPEEVKPLRTLFNLGRYELLTSAIPGVNITNEKEIEIQKMRDYLEPKTEGFESKMQKKVDVIVAKEGHDMSLAREAELQGWLDDEKNDWIAKKEGKTKERNEYLGRKEEVAKKVENDEEVSEKRIKETAKKAEAELPPPPPEPMPSVQESLAKDTIEKNVETTRAQAQAEEEDKKSKKSKK